MRRAQAAEDAADTERLESVLRQLVADYPNDPLGHAWLGNVLLQRQAWRKATEHLDEARRLAPDDVAILIPWSVAARGAGRVGEVVKDLRIAANATPSAPLLVVLADALRELGLDRERTNTLRRARQLEADNEEVAYNLAIAVRRESPQEALELLKAAVDMDPEYAVAWRELAFSLMWAGDWSAAEAALERVSSIEPADFWTTFYRAVLKLKLGHHSEAEDLLHEARRSCDLPIVHWLLGDLYEGVGDPTRAHEEYELAVKLDPYNLKALQRLVDSGGHESQAYWIEVLQAMTADDEMLKSLADITND